MTSLTVTVAQTADTTPTFDSGTISGLGARNIGSATMSGRIAALDAAHRKDGTTVIYVGAVQVLGLYVASAVYIALFMVILGKYSWLKSILISLSVIVLFFLMFEVWFKVPLFKGSVNLLSFLGY